MEVPIKSNGYFKYILQIGWLHLDKITIAVFAQDILAKTHKDAKFLMKELYPEPSSLLDSTFPHLCPIVVEINEEEEDTDILGKQVQRIDLTHPN
jgi:hypothetical protein